jgi:spore germination protein GerM
MTARSLTRVVLAMLVLACGACSVGAEPRAQIADDDAVPFGLLDPDVPPLLPPPTATVTEPVQLCFVQEGALAVVDATLDPPVDLDDVIGALADPPEDGSLRSAVSDPPLVDEVELVAGVARVDLRPAITALGGDEQLLAVAQLVCTLTARPGVGPVSFTLEGAPVDVPTGDGSLTDGPVSRDDYGDLLG